MVGFVSDGASVMIGKNNGDAAKLKKNEGIRGNDFFPQSPLYSSSTSIVSKEF
jgi:hypothetical protein